MWRSEDSSLFLPCVFWGLKQVIRLGSRGLPPTEALDRLQRVSLHTSLVFMAEYISEWTWGLSIYARLSIFIIQSRPSFLPSLFSSQLLLSSKIRKEEFPFTTSQ